MSVQERKSKTKADTWRWSGEGLSGWAAELPWDRVMGPRRARARMGHTHLKVSCCAQVLRACA